MNYERTPNWRRGRGRGKALMGPPAEPKPKCSECEKEEPAYKCPNCAIKYCSVTCCNCHKLHCNPKPSSSSDPEQGSKGRKYDYEFPSQDTVPLDKLLEMRNDERVTSLLKSSRLRSLIQKLDETQIPRTVFSEIMKDPEFRAFSNVVLEITGVRNPEDYYISD